MEGQEQEYEYSIQALDYSYQEFLDKGKSLQNCIIDKYVIYDQIGEGSFGCVYRGMDDKSKKQVAVKVIDMRDIQNEKSQKMKQIKMRLADTEPRLMQMCNSPNLLKCYDVYQNDDLKILMIEYCNGKTLQQEIDQKKSIPQNQAATILRHIINGLMELHKHKIVHRDLKADNIMSHNGTYKIIDFGFSKKLDIAQQMMEVKGTSLGTITTMAPEVMSRIPYGLKADIWSTGIIFFQMIYGIYPYDSQTAQQMYREIRKSTVFASKVPMKINGITPSQQAYDFLKFVIVFNTSQRPNWKQVSEHPLIKNINDSYINQRFIKQCQVVVDQKLNCDEEINQNMPIMSTLKRKNLNEEQTEPLRRPQPPKLPQTKQIQRQIYKPCEKIQEKVIEKPIQKLQKKPEQKQDLYSIKRPVERQTSKQTIDRQYNQQEQVIKSAKTIYTFIQKQAQQFIKEQESSLKKKKIADLMKREAEQQQYKKKAKQRQQQKINQQKKIQNALLVQEMSRKIEEKNKKQPQYKRQSTNKASFKQDNYLKKQARPIQIQKGVIDEKKKQINEEQAQQFAWTEKAHLQCLKTQLIFRQIINPIEMGKLIDVEGRKGVQFFYLLIARCLSNMSPVQYQQETRKKNKNIIDNLYIQIDAIYRQVSKKFQQFSLKLTSVQDKTVWKVYDFFKKKVDQGNFKKKDSFLTGIQNYEYSKSQQIQYTYDYYKKYIQPQMSKHPNGFLVCQRMEKYIQINSITMETINKRKKDFYKIVQQILTKK